MAIGHLAVRSHTRSHGHSVAAGLAYRFRTALVDSRTGLTHDYDRLGDQALATGFAYGETQPWWDPEDPQAWADAIEGAETRRNSIVARDLEVAVPHELHAAGRSRQLLEKFADQAARDYDMPIAWALHAPSAYSDDRNVHAHLYCATRAMDPKTRRPGKKLREFNLGQSHNTLARLRRLWQDICNEDLAAIQSAATVDMRAFARHDGYQVVVRDGYQNVAHNDLVAVWRMRRVGDEIHFDRATIRPGRTASVVENRIDGYDAPHLTATAIALERHERDVRDGDASPGARPASIGQTPARGRQSVAEMLEDGEPVTDHGRHGRRSLEERRANRKRRQRRRASERASERVLAATAPVTETVPPAPPAPDPIKAARHPTPTIDTQRDEPEPSEPSPPARDAETAPIPRRGRRSLEELRANRPRLPAAPTPAPAPRALALHAPAFLEIAVGVTSVRPVAIAITGFVAHQRGTSAVVYTRPDTPTRPAFVDRGHGIVVYATRDPGAILAALRVAQQRCGARPIRVCGTAAFRVRVLAIATQHGIAAVETRRPARLPRAPAPGPTPRATALPRPPVARAVSAARLPRAPAPGPTLRATALPRPPVARAVSAARLPRAPAPGPTLRATALPRPPVARAVSAARLPRAPAPGPTLRATALPRPPVARAVSAARLPRAPAPGPTLRATALPRPPVARAVSAARLPRAPAPGPTLRATALPRPPVARAVSAARLPRAPAPGPTPRATALPRPRLASGCTLADLRQALQALRNQIQRLLNPARPSVPPTIAMIMPSVGFDRDARPPDTPCPLPDYRPLRDRSGRYIEYRRDDGERPVIVDYGRSIAITPYASSQDIRTALHLAHQKFEDFRCPEKPLKNVLPEDYEDILEAVRHYASLDELPLTDPYPQLAEFDEPRWGTERASALQPAFPAGLLRTFGIHDDHYPDDLTAVAPSPGEPLPGYRAGRHYPRRRVWYHRSDDAQRHPVIADDGRRILITHLATLADIAVAMRLAHKRFGASSCRRTPEQGVSDYEHATFLKAVRHLAASGGLPLDEPRPTDADLQSPRWDTRFPQEGSPERSGRGPQT